jgi:Zn-dependent M16 (insulinase) family peptidase
MSGWGGHMRLSNNPSLGLIVHELGHMIKSSKEMRKLIGKVSHKGTSHHGLRFQTCIWNIHDWAKKKGYWQDLIQKRRNKQADQVVAIIQEEKKMEKPENVLQKKIDDTRKKIQKHEDAKVRYNKKLQRLQKLYATKGKKANRSIGALKRALVKYEKELENNA